LSRWLAVAWLVACGAGAGWLLHEGRALERRIDTDLFALLPTDTRDPLAESALGAMAAAGERQLVVLVGDADTERAAGAARALSASLAGGPLHPSVTGDAAGGVGAFYAPHRGGLLSADDRARLGAPGAADYFAQRALAAAFAPLAGGVLPWSQDPFALYGNWLAGQGSATRVRPQGGQLVVESGGRTYVVLPYELDGSAFALAVQEQVTARLATAVAAARAAAPGVEVLAAGIVRHAAAAATAAQREMSIIGSGSTLGVLLLVVVVFGGLRPAALMVLSLLTGTLLAAIVSFAVFGHVHVLTLVFGSSLIGVAVDYGLLALGASLGSAEEVAVRYRRLLPAMLLALTTTLVGYLALAATPFTGLAQMAVFSAAGISGAWLTVVLWFPHLAPPSIAESRASRRIGAALGAWPRLGARGWPLVAALAAVVAAGLVQLRADDDVRALVRPDPTLLREQLAVGRVLDLPSPAQFFIIEGADPEATLVATERLAAALDGFVAGHRLSGYDSVTRWVPSAARQAADGGLVRDTLLARGGALARVAVATGLDPAAAAQPWQPAPPLTVAAWLADPVSAPFRYLWLGRVAGGGTATLVLLKGLGDAATGRALGALAGPGVRYVDKPAQVSQLFKRQRQQLALLLAAGYALAAVLLWARYRAASWRALAPTAVATLLVLAVHGLAGLPVQLLTLVSLLLLLGMGVDYGIFLMERPADGRMFVAICLSAASTLLSFGLLAFSSTPALHAFGLATLLGIVFVWLIAPLCRPPRSGGPAP
jgi:predicted exporter